ncbi:extracellular solute-binding protein [Phycicoccus sp. BSK3Z-2]|uniref:Extracellular solute-binding protein n=1 Tax=Phycicoccus avicenniae TaxID=2828860 RepID=A0A941HYC1_9MICO|nr:extracellular solute-binding protein [Phycicoccus avicenniae]MBR7741682.1 extracellular solute-binding protein [Phycicoccus avicenniae]
MDRGILKRAVATSAGIAVGAAMLAGCGQREGGETAAPTATVDSSPATGEIVVWAAENEGQTLEALAETFQEENPDVTVTITPITFDDLPRKIDTAVAGGEVPDIVQPSTGLQTFVTNGAIAPVPADLVDTSIYFDGALDAATFDDVLYGVPWYVTVQSYYFREDIAEEAGLEAPTTWDEAVEFAGAMQEEGVDIGNAQFTTGVGAWQTVLPLIFQAGGNVVDDEGNFVLDSPEVVEALDHYQRFFREGVADPTYTITAAGEVEADLADGRVGSYTTGSYSYGIALDALDGDESKIGVSPLPAGPESNAGYLGGSTLSVMEGAENADAAWKFIRYATTVEAEQQAYDVSGVLPAARDSWNSGPLADSAEGQAFAAQLEESVPAPKVLTWTEVRDVIAEYAEQVAREVITPEEAAAAIQDEAERIGTGE